MTGHPQRIQRQRTKSCKMPLNTVYVGRPSMWGNPFKLDKGLCGEPWRVYQRGVIQPCRTKEEAQAEAVNAFRLMLLYDHPRNRQLLTDVKTKLRGKNLACWCPLDQPCHADVLLELANS